MLNVIHTTMNDETMMKQVQFETSMKNIAEDPSGATDCATHSWKKQRLVILCGIYGYKMQTSSLPH